MKSGQSLSDRLLGLFPSSEDNLIAVEIIKFLKKDPKEVHSKGYPGPKRKNIIKYVQNILNEKHGYHDVKIIDSVITQLESHCIIHPRDEKKKGKNRHYSLDRAYEEFD